MCGNTRENGGEMVPVAERLNPEVIAVTDGQLRATVNQVVQLTEGGLDQQSSDLCLRLLREAWGAATLCELYGLRLLFDESAAVIRAAVEGTLEWASANAALQDVFRILPRLLDWLVAEGHDNPCLLIPEITALRALQRKPPVYEYQVLPHVSWAPFDLGSATLAQTGRETDLKQILHIYQLGLVGVLRGENRARGIEIMVRCAGRLAELSITDQERNYWTLYQLVLVRFSNGGLALRPDRMRLLAAVEKQLRSLAGVRAGGGTNPYPEGLWRAFLVLLAISMPAPEENRMDWLPLPNLGFVDDDLEHIRTGILGRAGPVEPGPFQALEQYGLRLREALVVAAQSGGILAGPVLHDMDEACTRIAGLAAELGLANIASRFLRHQGEFVTGASPLDEARLADCADSILYLECALADCAGANLSEEQLTTWGERSLDDVLQAGFTGAARNCALAEAGAVLGTTKARIGSLQDGIISDDSWRDIELGFAQLEGMAGILDLAQLGGILRRAREFVQTSRYHPELGLNDRARNLNLFADMVIALEVYLDALRHGRGQEADSLRVADECVAGMRF